MRRNFLVAWLVPGFFFLFVSGTASANWDFGMDPSDTSAYGTEEGTGTGNILDEPGIAPPDELSLPRPESPEQEMNEGTETGTYPEEELSPPSPESSEQGLEEGFETGTFPESEIAPEESLPEEEPTVEPLPWK